MFRILQTVDFLCLNLFKAKQQLPRSSHAAAESQGLMGNRAGGVSSHLLFINIDPRPRLQRRLLLLLLLQVFLRQQQQQRRRGCRGSQTNLSVCVKTRPAAFWEKSSLCERHQTERP